MLPRLKRPVLILSAAKSWLKKSAGGFTDFDVAIATPDMMGVVGPTWSCSWSTRFDAVSTSGAR